MDPDATLRLLEEALEEDDLEAAREHARALREWLARGGFAPKVLQ